VSWFLSVPVNVGIKVHCDFVVCFLYVYIFASATCIIMVLRLMLAVTTYYLGCIMKASCLALKLYL
jgi:hypothetical protein